MTYQTIFFQNPDDFLEKTLTDLARNETRNNLLLGLAFRLRDDLHFYSDQQPLMAVVTDSTGQNYAIAVMTPPYPIIVQSDPVNLEAFERLLETLEGSGWQIPGVNGVSDASDAFTRIWQERSGQPVRLSTRLRAYELREVRELEFPPGVMRIAEVNQAQRAANMLNAMSEEIGQKQARLATRESALKIIQQGGAFFWVVDRQVVSFTLANRPQVKGICISGVYTPPQHRRKGYARALVAEVSKEMLSRGYELTNLFTDLANPTSNKIYQEIGYQPVCDYHQYMVE